MHLEQEAQVSRAGASFNGHNGELSEIHFRDRRKIFHTYYVTLFPAEYALDDIYDYS